jgi:hypothetical protein
MGKRNSEKLFILVLFYFMIFFLKYWNYFFRLSGNLSCSTLYDRAPLRSLVLEKDLMLGVLQKQHEWYLRELNEYMSQSYMKTMYFSLWKPPEVSVRMWSVNLDASVPGV